MAEIRIRYLEIRLSLPWHYVTKISRFERQHAEHFK